MRYRLLLSAAVIATGCARSAAREPASGGGGGESGGERAGDDGSGEGGAASEGGGAATDGTDDGGLPVVGLDQVCYQRDGGHSGRPVATCAAGLQCCYPCGIPGCDSVCWTPEQCRPVPKRP